ncbi:hypothetical protein HKD37_07G019369 [Glycine soja]
MRFTPSFYDDPRGALFKLMQHDSFNAYLSEFKALANRTMGLPPPFLLSCFIFELSLDILCEVQALPPLSLVQAAALAKLQEDKLFYAPPQKTTFKKLTPAEMASHREKGLCYNCDECYGPNHHCHAKFFLLIASKEDYPIDPTPTTDPEPSSPIAL